MGKIVFALFLPGLLVVLFTRITYNRYVALLLAIALIAVSVYAGYTSSATLFVIDALSLTVGFAVATHLMKAKEI
ncbi:DUF2198 family protein [Solibacillus sp. CAU 1738]|uniref:DUF2198 family protein n=1 Tax=Solibacillus sp. CAU 1738 TaxID=3140363 RepID=UPI003260C507